MNCILLLRPWRKLLFEAVEAVGEDGTIGELPLDGTPLDEGEALRPP